MSQHKKNYSGVKITQTPGGNSSFSLNWGHVQEPVKKNLKNPEFQTPSKLEVSKNEEFINTNSEFNQGGKKTNVKISNPPGGKSSISFG